MNYETKWAIGWTAIAALCAIYDAPLLAVCALALAGVPIIVVSGLLPTAQERMWFEGFISGYRCASSVIHYLLTPPDGATPS